MATEIWHNPRGSKSRRALAPERPILIERPVVFHGEKGALGRPSEQVLALFE